VSFLSFKPRGKMGADCCPGCRDKRKDSALITLGEDRSVSPREATTWKALFSVGLGLGLALGLGMGKRR
jgi:hypothetical protein